MQAKRPFDSKRQNSQVAPSFTQKKKKGWPKLVFFLKKKKGPTCRKVSKFVQKLVMAVEKGLDFKKLHTKLKFSIAKFFKLYQDLQLR